MLNSPLRSIAAFFVLLTSTVLLHSQAVVPTVATGTYSYGTFDNPGFDTINVGNLDVHFAMQVLNKAGRGMPFYYDLSYDSSVWSVGQNSSAKTAWVPVLNLGWRGVSEMSTGYLSGVYSQQYCYTTVPEGPSGSQSVITGTTIYAGGFVYHDQWGVAHPFSGQFNIVSGTCGTNVNIQTLGNAFASDGSGYQYVGGPNGANGSNGGNVVDKNGKVFAAPFNTGSGGANVTDNNGNEISVSGTGQFTDTTGNVALTVAGGSPSAQTFTYRDTNGNPQAVTMNYTSYTVETNFGCSGIAEFPATSESLVSSIVLADGSSTYSFNYEATPGVAGAVTGRLASVTLPQGGVISYTYTGGHNGIECADGSAAGLTRTLASSAGSAASTWTYTRTTGTGTSQTNVVDGLNNHKTYNFVEASNQPIGTTAQYYETNRTIYQGAASGTPVVSRQTCYDGAASPCTIASFTVPISEIDTYETLNGLEMHGGTAFYDAYGNLGTLKTYDFGGSSARGALLQTQGWDYNNNGEPTYAGTDDGSGNWVAGTYYTYDGSTPTASSGVPQHTNPPCTGQVVCARGNLTSIQAYWSSTNYLGVTATYEDTGSVLSITQDTGTNPPLTTVPIAIENFTYDPTFVYTTGVQYPTPPSGVALSTGAGFDTAYTGFPLSSTDMNSNKTKVVSYDSMLRPTEITFPDGGETAATYSPTLVTANVYQSSSVASTAETQLDSYGPPSRSLLANGQSGNSWYQADSCYDANGNQSFVSYQYQGAGLTAAKICSGAGDVYAYDVLGRVTSLTRANGEKVTTTYSGRATKVVDQNGVTRISQVDGLGRPTVVCEISSNSTMPGSGAPVSCGTDIAGTGFTTTYSYNLANHTTSTTQGVQTRTFQTDMLGRTTSVTEPESGTTTYSYAYNSTGLVVTRTKPTANQSSSTVLTTTTTQYDSLSRPVSITYSDGTPTKSYKYDVNAGWGLTQPNIKGQLSWAYAATTLNGAATIYGYDPMGRINQMSECTPATCNTSGYNLNYTYDLAGNMLSSSDGAGVTNSYAYSQANELTSLTSSLSDATHPPDIVSNVHNGPNGPVSFSLGNGLTGVSSYDGLGRLNGGWVCNGSSIAGCTGGVQLYGFFGIWSGSQLTTSSDTVLNQPANYGYDEFNRLTSRTITGAFPAANYTWTYDRWGNRTAQTPLNGGFSFSASVNTANNQLNGYTYDAAGNMTNDGNHSYTYDAEGNLTAVDGGATASYVYDALNHRVRTVVDSQVTEFVFNQSGQRVSTWKPGFYQLAGQSYWGAKPVEFYVASVANYQHQDWLGTERLRTTYNGAVEGSYQSLPFGDGQTSSGEDYDAYHFAVLDTDSESATDHAQFRQYSPAQGRWMRPDPYAGSYDANNPQSFNRYSYVLNNPLAGIDPSGLNCDIQGNGCPGYGDCANDPNCSAGDVPGTPGWGGGGVGSLWAQSSAAEMGWLGSGSISWFSVQGGVLMLQLPSSNLWTQSISYAINDDGSQTPIGNTNGTLTEQENWMQVSSAILSQSSFSGPTMPVAPNNGTPTVMPHLVCGVEGCQAVSGNPVVIPKYVKCLGVTTVAGGTGGFFVGVATSWFTAGTSIGAATIVGAAGGFGTGLVACAFYN